MKNRTLIVVLLVGGSLLCLAVFAVVALFATSKLLSDGRLVESLRRAAEKSYYWSYACISADKTRLAAVGKGADLVDLASGRVEQLATAYFYSVTCLPDGSILARGGVDNGLYAMHEASWLDGEGGQSWTGTLLGAQPNGQLVGYSRSGIREENGSPAEYRWTGPLTLYLNDPHNPESLKQFHLPPEYFPELGEGGISYFITDPVLVLDDGRVLLLAGFRCNTMGDFRGRPWGLFTVDLIEGYPEPRQPVRDCDKQVHTGFNYRVAASSDGRLVAMALLVPQEQVYVVGFDRDEGELFRTAIVDSGSLNDVSVSADGDFIAVVVNHKELYIIDGQTGQVRGQRSSESSIIHMEFLDDGSLVFATSQRIITRLNPGTDEVLWLSDAKQP